MTTEEIFKDETDETLQRLHATLTDMAKDTPEPGVRSAIESKLKLIVVEQKRRQAK
jgi:hypothetical protein